MNCGENLEDKIIGKWVVVSIDGTSMMGNVVYNFTSDGKIIIDGFILWVDISYTGTYSIYKNRIIFDIEGDRENFGFSLDDDILTLTNGRLIILEKI